MTTKKAKGWRAVLGFPVGSRPNPTAVRARHRELIRAYHTDVTGNHDLAAAINAARDEALREGAFAPDAHLATERAPKAKRSKKKRAA